jgi:hypothetical protein
LDTSFDVDAATLGQWLHDGLVDTKSFNMLPPLLCGSDAGASELAAAFFRSQAVFSAAGDVRQGEVVGHRSLPQALARLSLTHAQRTRSTRLGFQAQELRLGLLLEIYDRRSHEVLLSLVHEGQAVEKQHERYRQVDLANAWRELARQSVQEAAAKASRQWNIRSREIPVTGVKGQVVQVEAALVPGERGDLLRAGAPVKDRDGGSLGAHRRGPGRGGWQPTRACRAGGACPPSGGPVLSAWADGSSPCPHSQGRSGRGQGRR